MGRAKQLSTREKGKIDAYSDLNLSITDISRRIRRSFNVVKSYLQNKENYGHNYKGRQKKLSTRDRRRLCRAASNSTKTSRMLKSELNLNVSRHTICRELKDKKIVHQKVQRRPNLTPTHKEARLNFCRKNMQLNFATVWFSDEKRWCLDGPDNLAYYWHDLRKEPVWGVKRQGGGGSLMVWGAICNGRMTSLCFLDGNVDSIKYQHSLQDHFLPYYGANQLFMQDNASVHKSASTTNWLALRKIDVLDWPSRSPDLNPIENVWGILVRQVYKDNKQYSCLAELRQAIQSAWNNLKFETLLELTNSVPTRIFDCIAARGGHINY